MADTLVGFGLGLQGTPKDYTSIVAARERQKAADEERIKAAKLKEYDDVAKALVPKRMLPYQKEDYIIKTGDTLKKLQEAIQNGDNNTKNTLLTQHALLTSDLDNEYKAAEDYRVLSNRGSINADTKVTPDEIWNAKNRQEVIEKSGGDFKYNPQTGTLNFYPTAKYDVVDAYKKSAETVPTGAWKTVQITDAYGAKRMEAIPNEDEYLKNLRIQWDTNVQARENAIRNYKRKNNLSGTDYDTPEEQQKLFEKAEEDYLADGLQWGLKQKYQIIRKPGGGISMRTYVSTATEGPKAFGAPSVGGSSFGRVKYKSDGTIDRSFSYEIPDIKQMSFDVIKSLTTTADIRNRNTGIKYEPNAVSDAEWGAFEVVPIYNNNIGPQFVGMIATDEEARNPDNKNKIDWKVMAVGKAKAAKFDPDANGGKGGFVLDENDNYVMDDASVYAPADKVKTLLKQKLTRAQVPEFERYWDELQRDAEDKNAQLRGGGGSRSTPPTGGGGGGGKSKWDSFEEK